MFYILKLQSPLTSLTMKGVFPNYSKEVKV